MRKARVQYIGKESNRIEEVESGLLHSEADVYTRYGDTRRDDWETKNPARVGEGLAERACQANGNLARRREGLAHGPQPTAPAQPRCDCRRAKRIETDLIRVVVLMRIAESVFVAQANAHAIRNGRFPRAFAA